MMEPITMQLAMAGCLMELGVWVFIRTERNALSIDCRVDGDAGLRNRFWHAA